MLNPLNLNGQIILITGASSGIGRESAILLSKLGARLILVGRNEERLMQTMSQLESDNHVILPYDICKIDDIPAWLKSISQQHGKLTGLVHSAGVQFTQSLRFVTDESIEQTLQINLRAAIHLAKGFRQKSVSINPSSLVFISSVMGLVGQPAQSIYSASKGALIALTKSLALELARDGIRVNCVAPGLVQTEMSSNLQSSLLPEQFAQIERAHPLGLGTPLDVAYAIAFLLADTSRWVTGSTLVIDGGYTAQ